MTTTLESLQSALQKSGAQSVTIFRNGSGHIVTARWGAPAFQSLPELSKLVAEINGSASTSSTPSTSSTEPQQNAA